MRVVNGCTLGRGWVHGSGHHNGRKGEGSEGEGGEFHCLCLCLVKWKFAIYEIKEWGVAEKVMRTLVVWHRWVWFDDINRAQRGGKPNFVSPAAPSVIKRILHRFSCMVSRGWHKDELHRTMPRENESCMRLFLSAIGIGFDLLILTCMVSRDQGCDIKTSFSWQ